MRRFLPLLVVIVLVAGACGDDGAPAETTGDPSGPTSSPPATSSSTTSPTTPTSSLPPPSSTETTAPPTDEELVPVPPLLVASETSVDLVESTPAHDVKVTPVLTVLGTVTEIRQASDGSIFVQEALDPTEPFDTVVARYTLAGERSEVPDARRLYDVGEVGGIESVIVQGPEEDLEFGASRILAVPLTDGAPVDLGPASDVEFGVGTVDVFGGVAVMSAGADLTEVVYYEDVGAPAPTWSPTDDLPYGEPPLVIAAAFSFDGTHLYWAEGPDWGFIEAEATTGPIAAPWEVWGADLATGETTLTWPVSETLENSSELAIASIIDVGSHLVMNRSSFSNDGITFFAPLVLDFTVEEPELWEMGVTGVATLALVVP